MRRNPKGTTEKEPFFRVEEILALVKAVSVYSGGCGPWATMKHGRFHR